MPAWPSSSVAQPVSDEAHELPLHAAHMANEVRPRHVRMDGERPHAAVSVNLPSRS